MEQTISLLGVGFYIRAEAARLLKVHPARLNRWVHGYTYRIREESRDIKKYQRPIVRVDLPTVDRIRNMGDGCLGIIEYVRVGQ